MQRILMKAVRLAMLITVVPVLAHANGIIIGAPGDRHSTNCYPFGCSEGTIYQQVYAATDFSAPIDITSFTFYNHNSPPGSIAGGTYDFSLSTTQKPVNGLDTATYSNNVGPDVAQFFNGFLGGPIAGGQFTVTGTGFHYNPSNGNLLLEVDLSSPTNQGGVFLDARNNDAHGLFSRATDFGGGSTGTGLVTGFDTATEPGSFALLGSGVVALIGLARRRFS